MVTSLASHLEERTIAEVKRISHAGLAAPDLLRRVARALHRSVPFDCYGAATTDVASNLITQAFHGVMSGQEDQIRAVHPAWFERVYFEEGLDQARGLARSGQVATTISEVTGGQPERSVGYRDIMQPAGLAHQAHAVFVDRGLWGDMELYRASGRSDFSSRELDLLRRIAPDVGAGLKMAALRSLGAQEAVGDTTPGVLFIDRGGQVTATPAAESLLGDLGSLHPNWRAERDLPVPVQVVLGALRQTLAPAADADRHRVPRLRMRSRTGRWLTLHADQTEPSEDRPSERVVVIAPAPPEDVAWLALEAYAFTPREEEIVKLVVAGLSTRQIADRLFIAEPTVQRHLTNVFEKVGVRSRRDLVKQMFFSQVLPGAGMTMS